MVNKEFYEFIEGVYKEGLEILKRKNADYATQGDPWKNFRFAEIVGVPPEKAILVRISDKLARISNLIDKGSREVLEETIRDTIVDMCNYTAILGAYIAQEEENTNGKEALHSADNQAF